jgi:hypothetical protein
MQFLQKKNPYIHALNALMTAHYIEFFQWQRIPQHLES